MPNEPQKTELTGDGKTHGDIFVEHYSDLYAKALTFKLDSEQAEDLLHDFYIRFTLAEPDLSAIENLENYLYIVMRNLYLSQLKKSERSPLHPLSVVNYDTIELSYWVSDPRERMRLIDELRAVCEYACLRKESSKAGSVLILRFFHGYFPEEIANVLCMARKAVKQRLAIARAEAKLYLEDPTRLSFIGKKPIQFPKHKKPSPTADLRLELRQTIFNSCQGEHFSREALIAYYISKDKTDPSHTELAHLVSCPECLDNANGFLLIPKLKERYPEDMLGRDTGNHDDDSKGGGSGNEMNSISDKKNRSGKSSNGGNGAGVLNQRILEISQRRHRDVYYHEPEELCIFVNGDPQGLQQIISEKSEMTLIIDNPENLEFIEVFSEQEVRLLMLDIIPSNGKIEYTEEVTFSYGRTLKAHLNCSGEFPKLHIAYHDPGLAPETLSPTEAIELISKELISKENAIATPSFVEETMTQTNSNSSETTDDSSFTGNKGGFRSFFSNWRWWLQPERITLIFAVVVIAGLLWFFKFAPPAPLSAEDLLEKSVAAEETQLAKKERVLHRTLNFEEYNSTGQITSRKKIDVWQSAEKGITARRLYDEQGRLTMGDWRRSDGIQTIYKRGEQAKLQQVPEKRMKSIAFDDAWQLSVSAKEFLAILDQVEQAQLETRDNKYFISYAKPDNTNTNGIIKASIVLSQDDLHALEQRFTLRYGEETREYRIVETSFEWRANDMVAPGIFEPNVELIGKVVSENRPLPPATIDANTNPANLTPTNNSTEPANSSVATIPAYPATAALEVQVIDLLNNANAFTGEQINVQRTSDGKLQITGLVDTTQRKNELINALAPVKSNPAVRIKLETFAEAEAREARQKKGATSKPEQISVDRYEATENTSPVYQDLRKKFSEPEIGSFVDRVLNRSAQSRRHALALKQLSDRFSAADLESLSAAEKTRWLTLLRSHADKFLSEFEIMKRELTAVFPDLAGGGQGRSLNTDQEIQAAVRDLFKLSVSCEDDLNSSLARFSNQSGTAEVKTAKFWRNLNNAAALARSLQAVR